MGIRALVQEVRHVEPNEVAANGVVVHSALVDERALHHVRRILAGVGPFVVEELGRCLAGHRLVGLRAAGMGRAAAVHAHIPRHRRQHGHRAERLVGVVGALHALAHADTCGLRLAVLAGKGLDDVHRHARQLAGALQGILGRPLLQMHEGRLHGHAVSVEGTLDGCFHALGVGGHGLAGRGIPHHVGIALAAQVLPVVVAHEQTAAAVLGEELLIVAVVGDDPVDHAERERRVAAGADGNPLVGDGGGRGEARINVDDLRTALAGAHNVAQLARVGVGQVAAPDDHHVRVLLVVARVVGAADDAVDHLHAHGSAVIAHDALDVPGGGTVASGEARGRLHGQLALVARERVERAGGGAVFLLRLLQTRRDLVHGLIPADALEFAAAALARALHGVHDAQVLVLHALDERHGAQAGVGVIGTARHLARLHGHEFAVAHVALQQAARGAVVAAARVGVLGGGQLFGGLIGARARLGQVVGRLLGRSASRGTEPQGACHGNPADALDEGAAVHLPVFHEFDRTRVLREVLDGALLVIAHNSPFSCCRAVYPERHPDTPSPSRSSRSRTERPSGSIPFEYRARLFSVSRDGSMVRKTVRLFPHRIGWRTSRATVHGLRLTPSPAGLLSSSQGISATQVGN